MNRELEAVKAVLAPLPKALRLLDEVKGEFHPEKAGPWSTGELLLVDVAAALWRGTGEVDLGRLVNTLGGEWLEAVLRGIAIHRGLPLPAVAADGTVTR